MPPVRIHFRTFGLCVVLEDLGVGLLVNRTDKERVRMMLKPWIVEAALPRLGTRRLSVEEQRIVAARTRTPEKARWPDWWA